MPINCRMAVPLVLVLLMSSASAQSGNGNLKVRVVFPDGRPCNIPVHVQLMESAGISTVAETYTNDGGVGELYNLAAGTYHLVVSGQGIESADSGTFEVDTRKLSQSIYVTVRRQQDANQPMDVGSGMATVASVDMNIPENASKEFDKATVLMNKQDWKRAIDHLNKALAIYPQYVAAWNNLGATYARLGDRPHEREALQKAVSLNDHFAPAFVNLAKMAITDHDMAGAETFLEKASATDPSNIQTLILLANVELLQQHYDQAIATCRKVHSLPGDSHALVHYIAAHAFEHENRFADAVTEFEIFLKEEPSGERANAVRKQLSGLQDQK